MTPRIVYRPDVTNNKTDEYKYYYGVSDTPFKERYENHKTSFRHRSHLAASDLSKYYLKLVDDGAVPTVKFSIAKRVKGSTFINNCNLISLWLKNQSNFAETYGVTSRHLPVQS